MSEQLTLYDYLSPWMQEYLRRLGYKHNGEKENGSKIKKIQS